ncbi:exodeoxyribonuclease V subunit beta [Limnohabitans sp. T6-5]|uniref:exodeoxyribonuclease V subunit beta n=1 Tax=Limnohabitans sp. T6-5 TaxID=1100724 RepID=UPI000D3436A9|nr:exodeoxyribonuclease V subunit beta [Limnohabitans sp. T6-5]PUE10823.1 exodeoxyribonuclease V subunit beta [Limnohabitans sp. T6-5]
MSQPLNALSFPLSGSRLIEASAGTGKTWTIAALYVRLVLGPVPTDTAPALPALMPQDILVMTFTRAATRELSDRIRARLTQAAAVFRGAETAQDPFLLGLMACYPEGPEREKAAYRLSLAAQAMDDAAVYTIDAWCQRMLREHAFDSGNLFEENLVADEAALRMEAVQDYWRESLYPMEPQQVGDVLAVWRDVDTLEQEVRHLLGVDGLLSSDATSGSAGASPADAATHATLAQVLTQAQQVQRDALAALKQGWDSQADALRDWLDDTLADKGSGWKKAKLKKANSDAWLDALKVWALSDGDAKALEKAMGKTGWDRFTPEGMADCREADAGPGVLPPQCEAFAQLKAELQTLPDPRVALRLHACARVGQRMAWLKQRSAQFGFADMLQRLDQALQRPEQGAALAERLRAQFPVAMIDEFQDTSPLQFRIFDRIYRSADNLSDSALLLIGDPKQSIYGFRGADILSYLKARTATEGRHYVLDTNYRSTQALVDVVNRWFDIGEQHLSVGAAFGYAQPDGQNPVPFQPVKAQGRPERLCRQGDAVAAMTLVHDAQVRSVRDAVTHMSALCAEQIVAWLGDPQVRFVQAGQADQRLKPKDIAVLVRTGKEADAVRQALRVRGVASVYLSDRDSVFESDEAADLGLWLRAVAQPQDMRQVRAALATATVGLSLQELHDMAQQGDTLDAYAEQMRALRLVWQNQGVLAMLRQSLDLLKLAARWRAQPQGERRLTNVLHLSELLQSASTTLDGEQALIRWLDQQMLDANGDSDEQIVRLESDEDLVKVVTIHKSKGLEYPVVCLPFAHSHRRVTGKRTAVLSLTDAQGERQNKLQFTPEDIERADADRLREDVRLWYVALTRPRHALWVGWSAIQVGNSPACVNHRSAPGHLLGAGDARKGEEWLSALTPLAVDAQRHALAVDVQSAAAVPGLTRWQRPDERPALREPLPCTARIDKSWTIASFSRLARDLSSQPVLQAALHMTTPRPADDEPPEEGSALSQVAASLGTPLAASAGSAAGITAPWHGFARGPSAGNFLHDQLEWLAGEGFALLPGTPLAERLAKRCKATGYEAQAPDVVQWLSRVVAQPLRGPEVPLQALQNVLPEMEFWLPADRLHAKEVDALCRQHLLPGVSRPKLPDAQLHGMLMGFADLVFEHQGRYWVLDYKSNHLGEGDAAYSAQALDNAMAHHRYEVQAALYMLALHRLLRARLGAAYDPVQHLGGAVYLFLRGIDGPAAGCCTLPAPVALMDGLDAMLGTGQPTNEQEALA